jgi:Carbohydrate-binding module 48 (Isoamylase N-terminal domain)
MRNCRRGFADNAIGGFVRRLVALLGIASLAGITGRPVTAQLSAGLGPSARGTSIGATGWETAAQLSSSLRFDHPYGLLSFDDVIERRDGALRPGAASFTSTFASPSAAGFRLVATSALERDRQLMPPGDRRSASASLSYRHASSGAWLGYGAERFSTPAVLAGLWRQFGSRATLSLGSTIRHGIFGRMTSTQTYSDTTYSSDTTLWQVIPHTRTIGDSSDMPSRRAWAETEARLGWVVGRVAFDGVVGWRPRIDTVRHATWVRGFATVAIAHNVALTLGAGTVTRQLPFAPSAGRFGSVSLRFAPAALVRPNAPPQITPAAGAFALRRNEAGEYVVSVRVPHARVVELSGDFNGWHPLRLEQVRGDVWEAALSVVPGTYRMNLRVDGERWIAPPGTTAVDDDFNGRVGLVIVR